MPDYRDSLTARRSVSEAEADPAWEMIPRAETERIESIDARFRKLDDKGLVVEMDAAEKQAIIDAEAAQAKAGTVAAVSSNIATKALLDEINVLRVKGGDAPLSKEEFDAKLAGKHDDGVDGAVGAEVIGG